MSFGMDNGVTRARGRICPHFFEHMAINNLFNFTTP
jgi:hypothetical protein